MPVTPPSPSHGRSTATPVQELNGLPAPAPMARPIDPPVAGGVYKALDPDAVPGGVPDSDRPQARPATMATGFVRDAADRLWEEDPERWDGLS